MTRYEQGFMNKCAEYGVDGRALIKTAINRTGATALGSLAGATGGLLRSIPDIALLAAGGGLGAAMAPRDKETKKKKRLLGALIGMSLAHPIARTAKGAVKGGILGNKAYQLADVLGAFRQHSAKSNTSGSSGGSGDSVDQALAALNAI